MKEKYIEERFDGPWHVNGNYVETPSSIDICPALGGEIAVFRYNKLLAFTAAMADAFDKANTEAFKQFYYKDSRPCPSDAS